VARLDPAKKVLCVRARAIFTDRASPPAASSGAPLLAQTRSASDLLWAWRRSASRALAAVVGEIEEFARPGQPRLQLAAESTGVTAFACAAFAWGAAENKNHQTNPITLKTKENFLEQSQLPALPMPP